ncbi:MAG: hypothetical protein J7518_10740 [Nocardioidaceae bacterium]|nr:hypothetical protein [Nocardioidaceae bacterium]
MRVPPTTAHQVREGSVTLAFRRWRKQDVKPGARFKTAAGVLEVGTVEVVEDITDAEAVLAGHRDAASVRKRLAGEEDWPVYRVTLRWVGEDPRIALRESAELSDEDVAVIDVRLERLDKASSHGPWTMRTLDLIRRHPQRRAPDLAAMEGRETAPFKIDVRKLKNLGLTVSFAVGYEISPRGLAYLERTQRR